MKVFTKVALIIFFFVVVSLLIMETVIFLNLRQSIVEFISQTQQEQGRQTADTLDLLGLDHWDETKPFLTRIKLPYVYVYDSSHKRIFSLHNSIESLSEKANTLPYPVPKETHTSVTRLLPSVHGPFSSLVTISTLKNGSLLVTELPMNILNDWVVRLQTRMAIVQIVITNMIAVLFLTFFWLAIVRPIKRLTEATRAVAGGNLSVTLPVSGKDEVGLLSRDFNNMTAKVKASYEHLEDQVQERTKELNQKLDEIERINKLMVDREIKMKELKRYITDLEKRLGIVSNT